MPYFNTRTPEGRAAKSDWMAAHPAAPLGSAAGKSAFYDEQRQLIYDAAKRAGVAHPEVLAEVGATQATLESAGGTRTPGGFNYYGIKSGGGVGTAGAPVSTQEEGAGGRYTTQASFAQFKDKQDAADAYVSFLQQHPSHYAGVLAAGSVQEGLDAQAKSGYATASNYGSTLNSINRQYGGAAAPPVQLNQPNTAPNGRVDISVSHINPPPGVSLGATSSGNGINLAAPRTEQLSLAGP